MKNLVSTLLISAALVIPAFASRQAAAEKRPTNACGCYTQGDSCFCEKKAKCGCPGECEPKGCEEERQKKLQKEIDEETKRAKEAEKAQTPKDDAKAQPEEAAEGQNDPKSPKAAMSKKMTVAQRKQLLKLLEAYLAENPEEGNRMLSELRDGLNQVLAQTAEKSSK